MLRHTKSIVSMATQTANHNLHKAKNAKKDEFYTQLGDIENELRHYRHHFKDKGLLGTLQIYKKVKPNQFVPPNFNISKQLKSLNEQSNSI